MNVYSAALCLAFLAYPALAADQELRYAIARQATPVYHRAASARPQAQPVQDQCGQVRELEFIALPGTSFKIVRQIRDVFEVTTSDYRAPEGAHLFVAASHLQLMETSPPQRAARIPEKEVIRASLQSAVGLPYVWGGNFRQGIAGMYRGVDCSGLLYEATGGATPRNTADLIAFGNAVPIAGLPAEQLLKQLQPLDLIVWNGHLIIVLDRDTAIESILNCRQPGRGGVVLTPLRQRLLEVMKTRSPADSWPEGKDKAPVFVVRRWLY